MITKPLIAGLLALGCVSAAAGGAYVAVRQNATDTPNAPAAAVAVPTPAPAAVAETEGIVTPEAEAAPPLVTPAARSAGVESRPKVERPAPAPARRRAVPPTPVEGRTTGRAAATPAEAEKAVANPAREVHASTGGPGRTAGMPDAAVPASLPPFDVERTDLPVPAEVLPTAPEREFIQVVLPASSVIGLQIDTPVTSERARVEDRVDARVTRDVIADGRVAIPAGSRVIGSVTLVEQGGKIKERARLGVRFHTIVFADGSELPIRTDPIYRDGESPSSESTKKIGGAAVGGAILGAIIGGGKGAMIGGAAGAAGGTAATMAGGRNPATLPAGTVVTVRLSEPLSLDLEKR